MLCADVATMLIVEAVPLGRGIRPVRLGAVEQ